MGPIHTHPNNTHPIELCRQQMLAPDTTYRGSGRATRHPYARKGAPARVKDPYQRTVRRGRLWAKVTDGGSSEMQQPAGHYRARGTMAEKRSNPP
ncbi:hypothetical protein MTO96_008088 [Rhipicephalus appendiculatus]